MSEILAVESTGKGKPTSIATGEAADGVSHCFEIRTANVDYFIGIYTKITKLKHIRIYIKLQIIQYYTTSTPYYITI